jgi:Cation transporting ATPase, C-terminus
MEKRQHYTIIFDTFVFLQFFNLINCRVVGPRDFNVFTHFFNNWILQFVLVVILFVQWSAS